jgi:hypothetical protein
MTPQGVYARFRFFPVNCLVCVLLLAVSCVGQQPRSSRDNLDGALKGFLQKELQDLRLGADKTTRFTSATIRSDGTTKEEIVVYISGQSWCGSGGCRLWILEPDGASFKAIGEMTVVWPPIRVLRTMSHAQPGYEALMRFDGKSYPANPSIAPAKPLKAKVAGKVLIARNNEGELLYK